MKRTVVIGLLGQVKDAGTGQDRWERWRPSVALCQQEDFLVDRFDIIHSDKHSALLEVVTEDIARVSPETEVVPHTMELDNPWDFEEVFGEFYSIFSILYLFRKGYG